MLSDNKENQNQLDNNTLSVLLERVGRLEQDSKVKDEKIQQLEQELDNSKKRIEFLSGTKLIGIALSNMENKLEQLSDDVGKKLQSINADIRQLQEKPKLTDLETIEERKRRNEYVASLVNGYMDDRFYEKITRIVAQRTSAEYDWLDRRVDKLQESMNEILEVKKRLNELALLSDKTGIERVFRAEMTKVSSDVKEKATELIISTVEHYLSDFGLTATDVKQISDFTQTTKNDLEVIATKIDGLDKKLTKKLKNYKARIETKIKEVSDRIPEPEEYHPWDDIDDPELVAYLKEIESMPRTDIDGYPIYDYKCEDYFRTEVTSENCDEIFNALVVDYSDYVKRVGSAQQFNKKENIKPTGNIWTFAVERVGYPYSNELKEALISRYGLTHNRFCELSGLSKSRVSRYKKDLDKLSALIVEEAKEDYQDYFFHSEIEKFMPFEIICFW